MEDNLAKETNESIIEDKEAKTAIPVVEKKRKEGSFLPIIFMMALSLGMAFLWDKIPAIKNAVHAVLDPSAGALINWNLTIGMLILVLVITIITTIVQKFATDQKALKELKHEQKLLQEEMKKYRDHPEKMAELSKKNLEFIPRTYKLMSRGFLFTGIPFIIFFRWFHDIFTTMGNPLFFGFLSWIWFYLISSLIFSSVLRKVLKVV